VPRSPPSQLYAPPLARYRARAGGRGGGALGCCYRGRALGDRGIGSVKRGLQLGHGRVLGVLKRLHDLRRPRRRRGQGRQRNPCVKRVVNPAARPNE